VREPHASDATEILSVLSAPSTDPAGFSAPSFFEKLHMVLEAVQATKGSSAGRLLC